MAEESTEGLSFGDQQRKSMEERVEALMGIQEEEEPKPVPEGDEPEEFEEEVAEDSDEEEVEAAEEETPELVEFEWDGQLLEAPPAIKDALMRQQDYTQKTQDIAAQRKAVEVQLGEIEQKNKQFEFVQQIQPDILKAQQLEAQAEQANQYLRDNIDDLSSTDIEKIRIAVDDARRQRDELVQSLTAKQQDFQQAQEQAHEELLNKGTEILRQRIPGWGEDAQKAVRDYALSSGYTEAEVQGVVDPRQVETLWKASQYDALQEGKVAAVQKVTGAPKIKPKSRNPMPEDVKSKLNLRKKLKNSKLSDRDKARLIQDSLGDRFG